MMEVEKSFFSHYPDPQTAVHLAQLIPANRYYPIYLRKDQVRKYSRVFKLGPYEVHW